MPFRKKKSKNEDEQSNKPASVVQETPAKDNTPTSSEPIQSAQPEQTPHPSGAASVTNTDTSEQSSGSQIVEQTELAKKPKPPLTAAEANAEINSLLLSIVSGFSDYFIGVATEIFEKTPKNITFDSIRSDRKIGTTGIQLVSVNFTCEYGKVLSKAHAKAHD